MRDGVDVALVDATIGVEVPARGQVAAGLEAARECQGVENVDATAGVDVFAELGPRRLNERVALRGGRAGARLLEHKFEADDHEHDSGGDGDAAPAAGPAEVAKGPSGAEVDFLVNFRRNASRRAIEGREV